jgi:hypothetical protein
MTKWIRQLIAVAFLCATPGIAADIEEVTLWSDAPIYSGGTAAARRIAIEKAYDRAIERIVSKMIDSRQMNRFSHVIEKTVTERKQRYIQNYRILDEGREGGSYRISLRIRVLKKSIYDDLAVKGVFLGRRDRIRLLHMITIHEGGNPASWWTQEAKHVSWIDSVVRPEFESRGLYFVNLPQGQLEDKLPTALRNDQLSKDEVMLIGRILGAALVVRGSVQKAKLKRSGQETVAARLAVFNTTSGETVASAVGTSDAKSLDAKKTALNSAILSIVQQITSKWVAGTFNSRSVRLIFDGVRKFSAVRAIKELITEKGSGVRQLRERYVSRHSVAFDCHTEQSTRELARRIGRIRSDELQFRVSEVNETSIRLKVR